MELSGSQGTLLTRATRYPLLFARIKPPRVNWIFAARFRVLRVSSSGPGLPHHLKLGRAGSRRHGRRHALEVKITVKGPDDRRVEHVANIQADGQLHDAVGVAFELYRRFYPDAPPFRKTVEIDPA